MYALVDCNNFYVSCERVFQPKFNGKPVIVLSNNDGCAIARSEEAKALGIQMGAPIHLIQEVVKKHKVKLFSSNYTLYGDMSRRVYSLYDAFSPEVENYSIDEAFLFLGNMPFHSLYRKAITLRAKVKQWTGIPVSVGLAPTKTLAKMANRFAKKTLREEGVYALDNDQKIKEVLHWCSIGDVWGIGPRYAAKLQAMGIQTAYEFTLLPEEWIRKNMTVVGQRMYNELRGKPSISFDEVTPAKKGICTSRSFGKMLTDQGEIRQAVANFAARCALKLRTQNSCAGSIQVFLHTNRFRPQDKQFNHQITIKLLTASNSTNLLIYYALKGLDMLYKEGYNFQKAGVIVEDIVSASEVQQAFWQQEDSVKNKAITKTLDSVNAAMGRDTLRFVSQGYSIGWKLRSNHLSKCYTTRLDHVVKIKD